MPQTNAVEKSVATCSQVHLRFRLLRPSVYIERLQTPFPKITAAAEVLLSINLRTFERTFALFQRANRFSPLQG